jgi:hypothetical protein
MNTFWFPRTSLSDPDYVPTVYEFETTAELLALDAVHIYNTYHKSGATFVMSGGHLMALYKDGFEWWVVGRVGQPEKINLPEWEGPKVRVKWNGIEKTVVGKEILSMCGDEITLRDGSIAIRIQEKK